MKRTAPVSLIVLSSLLAVCLVAAFGFGWTPRLLWAAAFRNRHCGFWDGLHGGALTVEMSRHSGEIGERSHLVQTDVAADLQLWTTPMGEFWIPAGDAKALAVILAEQTVRVYGDGPRRVQKGDIVLDCGAHVGVFVREALNAGASKVVAIEPIPDKLECLRRNFRSEINSGRVVLYPKGVWDRDDSLTIWVNPRHSGGDTFAMHRGRPAMALPLTTIDRIVAELRLPEVDFIKMDIEGAEERALDGASETVRTHRPVLALAVYHLSTDRERIPAKVRQLWPGYRSECRICQVEGFELKPQIESFY